MKINRTWRNIYHRWPVLFGMLLLTATLMVCSLPSSLQAEEAISRISKEVNIPCKGLKSYNNLDELLYQFYINLDSDCLFKMPLAALEKIWGVKILTHKMYFTSNYDTSDFHDKPYKSEKDAFYLTTSQHENSNMNDFSITITKDYRNKHSTLLPDKKFPRLLPPPLEKIEDITIPIPGPSDYGEGLIVTQSYFNPPIYYWLNTNSTRMIRYSEEIDGLHVITVTNQIPKNFLEY